MSDKKYMFLEEEPLKVINRLDDRLHKINAFTQSNGLLQRWRKSYMNYYNLYYNNYNAGLNSVGVQGEFKTLPINQFRNLLQHVLILFTQNKVSYDSIPTNSDVEGRNSAIVGNALLEYYYENPLFYKEIVSLAEIGLLFGTSFLFCTWDSYAKYEGWDENMNPRFQGEFSIKSFTPLDVILEPFEHDFKKQNWILTRETINRFELISKYPHLKEEILALPAIDDIQYAMPYVTTSPDFVWIKKIYHKSTPQLPWGRYIVFSDETTIYEDHLKNPYVIPDLKTQMPLIGSGLPVTCFRPAIVYGSAFGFTPAFDSLPLQDMKNLLTSTIASNQAAFGVQNLAIPRGSSFEASAIAEGLRLIEFDVTTELPDGGIPKVLKLLETPAEIFNYDNKIDMEMERIWGVNGALRGTPPPQISSGVAIALLSTQSQTFNSIIEKYFVASLEELAMRTFEVLSEQSPDTDLIDIVGIKEKSAIPEFKAANLRKIKNVRVSVGNPLAKSVAGRLTMAQDLLQTGKIDPATYIEVAQTGSFQSKIEDITSEEAYINYENQKMMQGVPVEAQLMDNPLSHIKGHLPLLNYPAVRDDPVKLANVLKHISQHNQNWAILGVQNPQLLALITNSPIPPDVPQPGVVAPGQEVDNDSQLPPQENAPSENPGGIGKNTLENASQPGGEGDLAASGLRSAMKLMEKAV